MDQNFAIDYHHNQSNKKGALTTSRPVPEPLMEQKYLKFVDTTCYM